MRIVFAARCAPCLSFPTPHLTGVALVQARGRVSWPLSTPRLNVPGSHDFQTLHSSVLQGTGGVCTCTALAQTTVALVLGEIHCRFTWWLHSSPSGLSSLKLRLFNVLLPSTIVAAKFWNGRSGCCYQSGRVHCVGPQPHQPGCLFGSYLLLQIPFHSCWIHLPYSSLSIASQAPCLQFILIFLNSWAVHLFSPLDGIATYAYLEVPAQEMGKKKKKRVFIIHKALEKSSKLYYLYQHKIMTSNLTFLVYLFLPFVRNLASE